MANLEGNKTYFSPSYLRSTAKSEKDTTESPKKDRRKKAQEMIQNALGSMAVQSGVEAPTYERRGLALSGGLAGTGGAAQGSAVPANGLSNATMEQAVQKLIQAAPGKVTVTSGTRSADRQAELWAEALKKYGSEEAADDWVAPPPGYVREDGSVAQGSFHQRGLANDLSFENDAVRQWVHENAARFGLHFPLGNEPWHIELLGTRK